MPAPCTLSSNGRLPSASIAATSCCWEVTKSPLAFRNSKVTLTGGLGLALWFVNTPPSVAPESPGVKEPTVTSTANESATVR